MHVLVVEDDRSLAELLRRGLTQERHIVDVVHDGLEGLDRAASGAYDAVVLDLMLPRLDGLDVARRLRSYGATTPVLMLTARDGLHDRLRGFDAGADDYLSKPFSFEELLARLRAITRRSGAHTDGDHLVVGDLVLDRRAHTVTRARREINLSPKEYALLEYLMRNPDQVLTRTVLLERVWDYGFDSFANVVDVAIRRLRKAIDEGYERQMILTVRNVGYTLRS
jgi:DNA-binding response OmpR family regulator